MQARTGAEGGHLCQNHNWFPQKLTEEHTARRGPDGMYHQVSFRGSRIMVSAPFRWRVVVFPLLLLRWGIIAYRRVHRGSRRETLIRRPGRKIAAVMRLSTVPICDRDDGLSNSTSYFVANTVRTPTAISTLGRHPNKCARLAPPLSLRRPPQRPQRSQTSAS
jgi:hypothetical protein